MRPPSVLTILCICFCAGIIIAGVFLPPLLPIILLALLCLIPALIFRRLSISPVFLMAAVLLLGMAHFINYRTWPNDHIARITPAKGVPVRIEGVIITDPSVKKKYTTFRIGAERVTIAGRDIVVSGNVLVNDFGKGEFFYGQKWSFEGSLYRPPYFFISDKLNYRRYLNRQGIYSVVSVKKSGTKVLLDQMSGNIIKAKIFALRRKIAGIIDENMSGFTAGILSAIILGNRDNIPETVRDALVHTGTVHVIAISGLHLAIVGYIVLVMLTIMRIPRKTRFAFALVFIMLYCILTGARIPVLRATIMAGIVLAGKILDRRTDIYNSLALAALVILSINPYQLFDISFQLSFASIIALVWLSPEIMSCFPKDAMLHPVRRWGIRAFSSSAAAWMGLAPIIGYYFGMFSPVAIFANMVIVPYMILVVASALCVIVAGLILTPLLPMFSASSELLIIGLVRIAELFEKIPGGYAQISSPRLSKVLFIYAVMMAGFLLKREIWRKSVIFSFFKNMYH